MVKGVPAVTSKQESTGFTGKSRYVGCHVTWLPGASLGHKDNSSGLPSWSSVAVTGKPDAVKVARPVWSGGKTARSYLSLPRPGASHGANCRLTGCCGLTVLGACSARVSQSQHRLKRNLP